MKMTTMPARAKGTRTIRTSIEGGTIPAASDGERSGARVPRGRRRRGGRALRGACGCAAGALPAAVRGEDGAERREVRVVGGALLVIDHQKPLWARADRIGHVTNRLADVLLGHRFLVARGALGLV